MSYDALMPSNTSSASSLLLDQHQQSSSSSQMWKSIRREQAALDILSSDFVILPEEFVKTKHHCYLVKEYANGGTLA